MINEFIEKAKNNNIVIEVLTVKNENWVVETFNNKINNYNVSNNTNYKIKALYKDKNIYLSTSTLENVNEIVDKIKELYELSDNKDLGDFAKPFEIENRKIKNINLDIKKVLKFLTNLNTFRKKYSYLKNISANFYYINKENSIDNENTHLKDDIKYIYLNIEIVVKEKGKTETNYYSIFSDNFDEEEIIKKVTCLIKNTRKKIDAKSIKTTKTNVVLNNESAYLILQAFSSMFYAKEIRLGFSVLKNKYNKKVFSDKLTIVEDPSNENMIVSRTFDTEGTKTYYKEIVNAGVFKTKLYDNEEAKLQNTKSTGNSYGVINMYIVPGNKTFEELIKIADHGIIIDDIRGLHSGINSITGDFSVQCSGYEIENGKKCKPIKMIVMSSNIMNFFNSIKEIGNDLKFIESSGGSPSLLISNVDIAGSENE